MPNYSKFWMVVAFALIAWGATIIFSARFIAENYREHTVNLALTQAKTSLNKDWAIRSWANRHGGVYVIQSELGQPNKALEHLSERDISATNGMELTLMSPAYILRQTMEMYADLYGIKERIVSLNPLNPDNKAMGWEIGALKSFNASSESDVFFNQFDKDFSKCFMMRRLVATENCLKCHATKGFKKGDLVGGVGIALSLAPFLKNEKILIKNLNGTLVIVWTVGTVLLIILTGFGWRKLLQNHNFLQGLESVKQQHQIIIDSMDSPIYVADMETYELLAVNKSCIDIFGQPGRKKCYEYFQNLENGKPCSFCTNDKLLSAEGEPNGSYEWEFYNPIAKRHYLCHDKAIRWIDGRMVRFELAQDVTEAKKNEKERENLILQLGEAIGEIKRLQGILPICSYCKKIRNDEGAWNQLEEYICKHSNAEFTHGICPDCFEKLKDELD